MSDDAFSNPIFADPNPLELCKLKLKQYGFTLKANSEIVNDDTGKLLGWFDSVTFNAETNSLDLYVKAAQSLEFITVSVMIEPGD